MTHSQKRRHDNFFRTVFSNPKNTAKLISLAAENNQNLKELLNLINLDTLQEISGATTREGATGSADLTFKVEIKNPDQNKPSGQLIVGLILEHKSYRDSNVRKQLLKYYFEIMHEKAGDVPAVAIIVYNGKEKWNPLNSKPYPGYPEFFQQVGLPFRLEFIDLGREPVNFETLDPSLAAVIAAMRMVFDAYGAEKYFKSTLRRLLNSKENPRSILEEILIYLKETLPKQEKETIMDSLEVLENKGYTSIAEAERKEWFLEGKNQGFEEGEMKGASDKAREMAIAMLLKGYPISDIAMISGLTEEEIKTL